MIYYVEDDLEIKNLILYTLNASGFNAKGFSDASSFYEGLKEELPELIMLDIMLPSEDGLSILKKLKDNSEYASIPVIMCTAKGSEYDKVVGLEMGADDYLVKPFGMMEMIARIKAVLRRSKKKDDKVIFENGSIKLDTSKHLAYVDNNVVQLTVKEYDLLCLFMENIETVYSREDLLETIWGINCFIETRTVDVHIGTLRTKLGEVGNLIETIRGVGYRMVRSNEEENI